MNWWYVVLGYIVGLAFWIFALALNIRLYYRGKRRIKRGYCPMCNSHPPNPVCPICEGNHNYAYNITDETKQLWTNRWNKVFEVLK